MNVEICCAERETERGRERDRETERGRDVHSLRPFACMSHIMWAYILIYAEEDMRT